MCQDAVFPSKQAFVDPTSSRACLCAVGFACATPLRATPERPTRGSRAPLSRASSSSCWSRSTRSPAHVPAKTVTDLPASWSATPHTFVLWHLY